MRLMHKAELESSAEDIVNTVRETSRGKHKMDTREWNMLIQATDELYPDFKDALTEKLGHIDENELHVCYDYYISNTYIRIFKAMGVRCLML